MSSPTLLNLASFGRALVAGKTEFPSKLVCLEFFSTCSCAEYAAVMAYIKVCVPLFTHDMFAEFFHLEVM